MKRVLFVDDEKRVLEGLERMLYAMRIEWRMVFVTSAREALQLLGESDYDVLVTDLRMPEMNGIELLSHVSKTYPQTVRLVLSGTADQEITLRSATLVHQYLVKPCDALTLRTAIGRAFNLHVMLADAGLKQLVSTIDSLPSVPAVYARLIEVLGRPDASPKDIGQVISQDMSMTAKVLQLVNSACFGMRRQITDPVESVIYLGQESVRQLVLVASAFAAFQVPGLKHFSIESLQQHSLAVGLLAKDIATCLQLAVPLIDQAYVGGLLHAIGKLVLACNFPQQYDAAMCHAAQNSIPERIAELEAFGTTHAEVGAYLLWRWDIPDAVTEIVLRHHESPVDSRIRPNPTTIVNLADSLVKGGQDQESTIASLQAFGLGGQLDRWKQLYQESPAEH